MKEALVDVVEAEMDVVVRRTMVVDSNMAEMLEFMHVTASWVVVALWAQ